MSARFSRTYLVVPVVYIGVIFLLLFLQFSGGERRTQTVGSLTLQATQTATGEEGSRSVKEVSLRFRGLLFEFDDGAGLIVESTSDVVDVPLRSYDVQDDGFDIAFEGGYALMFTASSTPVEELQIRLVVPESSSISRISIPFEFADGAVPDTKDQQPFIQVDYDGRDYQFTSPTDAVIDPANNRVTMGLAAVGQAIRYVEATAGNPAVVASWFEDPSLLIGDGEYATLIEDYVDLAYRGWSVGRYNSRDVSWNGPADSAAFSEAALVAYLAEAMQRGDYNRAHAEMRRAKDLYPELLGLLSAPFLGDLRAIDEVRIAEDEQLANEIASLIEDGDAKLLARPGIFAFASHRGDSELYEAVVEFARSVDVRTIDVPTTIGIISNAVLVDLPDDSARDALARFVGLTQSQVISSIVRTDRGFFVETAPGRVDLFQTVVAGTILEEIGDNAPDELLVTIGRNLTSSALAMSDENGLLPASLLLQGEIIQERDGLLGPEEIYPVIVENIHYPHRVSLPTEAGSRAWAWTAVGFAVTEFSDQAWRFRLEYPRLQTHYVMVFGVPQFERMELFGQEWRDAPDFEIYSKGRHHVPESGTLMIKYYDDSEARDIVLFY